MQTLSHVVIGVKHAGDVLSQVPVQHGLNIISNIDCRQLNAS